MAVLRVGKCRCGALTIQRDPFESADAVTAKVFMWVCILQDRRVIAVVSYLTLLFEVRDTKLKEAFQFWKAASL
jgi:hypothetical protein